MPTGIGYGSRHPANANVTIFGDYTVPDLGKECAMSNNERKSLWSRLIELLGWGESEGASEAEQLDVFLSEDESKPGDDHETGVEVLDPAAVATEAAPATAPILQRRPFDAAGRRLLSEIKRLVSQPDGEPEALEEARQKFLSRYPDEAERMGDTIFGARLFEIKKMAGSGRVDSESLEAAQAALRLEFPGREGRVIAAVRDGRLHGIRRLAGRGNMSESILSDLKTAFLEEFPKDEGPFHSSVQQGRLDHKLCNEIYTTARDRGEDHADVRRLQNRAREHRTAGWMIERELRNGNDAYLRRKSEQQGPPQNPRPKGRLKKKLFPSASLVMRRPETKAPVGLHPNDLRAQAPSSSWQILIDETGKEFGPDTHSFRNSKHGRFVAIAIPGGTAPLKDLEEGWHAANRQDFGEIEQVVGAVTVAAVGLMGISVCSLPVTPGERWIDGVGLLFDWILRLIPIEGDTRIELLVEERGEFKAGHTWDLVARNSLRRLALAFPLRAARIDAKIRLISKTESRLNGYADAIAFTWGGGRPRSRQIMDRAGLRHTCLLESGAEELGLAWDAFAQGVALPPEKWWELISSNEAHDSSTIVGTFLEVVGEESREELAVWTSFLGEARRQVAGSSVNLERLGAAIGWLDRFQPHGETLPPMLKLTWWTIRLADSNHRGDTESQWEQDLSNLRDELLNEAAPLVCLAELHLAVAYTNRFEFELAQRCLERWRTVPIVGPGLRFWGRVQSSWGQHSAFS